MTKGPVALVLAGVFFFAGLACGRECRTALLSLRWKTGAALAIVLSLPWFVWMYYALGWHFIHQYALAGNLYYVTQPDSFSNRGYNHTLYISTFLGGLLSLEHRRASVLSLMRFSRAGSRGSGRGNTAVGLGRRRFYFFQHCTIQGRSVRVSGRAGVLSARRASVDERECACGPMSGTRATTSARDGRSRFSVSCWWPSVSLGDSSSSISGFRCRVWHRWCRSFSLPPARF